MWSKISKLKGRSWAEIRFRARQEWNNARLVLQPPRLGAGSFPIAPRLPAPDQATLARIRPSATGHEILAAARGALEGKYKLLGYEVDLPQSIPWRRDYVHGKDTPLTYFRRIRYLDFVSVGDHKVTWELNRHQHLAAFAQAWLLTGEECFLKGIVDHLESWWRDNPFHQGINWTSALEVAFRGLSWIWVDHWAGRSLPAAFRQRLVHAIYQHGCHLDYNLSRYFSPNTHLQGEAVVLHAMGTLYPDFPTAARWVAQAREVLDQELGNQVREDGAHFEQSSYYHVYATDFFLLHYLLAARPEHFRPVLNQMADYLHALLGPNRWMSFIGDDDGGRVFHPYGPHASFGRATLATLACVLDRPDLLGEEEDLFPQAVWWLGPAALATQPAGNSRPTSRLFPGSGTAILCAGPAWLQAQAGPFGPKAGGHTHAGTLGFVLRLNGTEILIDPGTFTYMGDPVWRNRFRGSAAHNTIRVNGLDHAPAAGPFAWAGRPNVKVLAFDPSGGRIQAEWTARGIRHERIWDLNAQGLTVQDRVTLPQGEHQVEQFWHPGLPLTQTAPDRCEIGGLVAMTFHAPGSLVEYSEGGEYGWRSRAYGVKEPAPLICVRRAGSGMLHFETRLSWL